MTTQPYNIPPRIRAALDAYIETGRTPGGWLTAVLSNDLLGSIRLADDESRSALRDVVRYLYWEVPMLAWGSPAHFAKWKGKCSKPTSRATEEARAFNMRGVF